MLVILKKNVKGTGKAGDIVKVSDGFANNRSDLSGSSGNQPERKECGEAEGLH